MTAENAPENENWWIEEFDPDIDMPPRGHHHQEDVDPPDLDSETEEGED